MTTVTKPGLYRGSVVADNRPVGTLTITVPGATGTKAIVATCVPVLVGWDAVSEEVTWVRYGLDPKTGVWVMFEQGNPAKPVVIGLL